MAGDDLVSVEPDPDAGELRRAVGVDRREMGEGVRLDQLARPVGKLHADRIADAPLPRKVPLRCPAEGGLRLTSNRDIVTRHLRWFLVLACAGAVAVTGAAGAAAADLRPYRGLATWVDIYDTDVWKDPEGAVDDIAARGVRTVYLETSNHSQRVAILRPKLVGRFVEAAHTYGLAVVAWYLPGFLEPARDVRRSLAAIDFRTPSGQSFNRFALDIEASAVKSPVLRTKRLLRVAADLRAAVGPTYPLGAIILSPRGLELSPTIWPGFPYRGLAARFDVFLPMVYFTYRTRKEGHTRAYVASSIAVLRRETGDPSVPIHVIGGIADRARSGQTKGFVDAVCKANVFGASLYDFATTGAAKWSQLSRIPDCTGGRT